MSQVPFLKSCVDCVQRTAIAALVATALFGSRASAFDLVKAKLDLGPFFKPSTKAGAPVRPLFREALVADLTGGGNREIILPGNDGVIRLLRLAGSQRKPTLGFWTTTTTRVAGDQMLGSCYLTAAPLAKGAPSSLVLALPRGIFVAQIDGDPRQSNWLLYCDRTFFDPGRLRFRPTRLDFLVDLDGDGTPEVWLPELDGMTFLRKKADGLGWDEVETPPLAAQVWQSAGATPMNRAGAQPSLHALRFRKTRRFPSLRLVDLDRDGRLELIAVSSRPELNPPTLRAECFALRDALHFTTTPIQVRETAVRSGSQTFVDLDGDGFLDLLRTESNLDIVTPRTVVEVFLSPKEREVVFKQPTYRYTTHDPVGLVLYGDWNRDGAADLVYSQFDYAFGSTDDLIDLILGKELSVRLRFLRGQLGRYELTPSQDLHLRIRNRCFNHRVFPPVSMEGDFDGDGASDLLVRSRLDRCGIYLSEAGGNRLSTRSAASFSIPSESRFRIVDLDGDGRSDVLVFDPEKPQVTAFLARP